MLLFVIVVVARVLGGAAGHFEAQKQSSDHGLDTQVFLGELRRFERDSASRAQSARNSYLSGLAASGWNSLFDPLRLAGDSDLVESFRIISKSKAALEQYGQQVFASQQANRNQIGSLNISAPEKTEMLSSYGRASRSNEPMLELEAQALSEAEKIISLLAARKKWGVENSKIVFYDDEDRSRVSAHFQRIEEISRQQQGIQDAIVREYGAAVGTGSAPH